MKKAGITGAIPYRTYPQEEQAGGGKTIDGPPFAETEPENSTRPLSYPTTAFTFLRDDIFVRAFHQMLVYGNTGREQPFL